MLFAPPPPPPPLTLHRSTASSISRKGLSCRAARARQVEGVEEGGGDGGGVKGKGDDSDGEGDSVELNICTARKAEGKEGWRNADTLRTEIPPLMDDPAAAAAAAVAVKGVVAEGEGENEEDKEGSEEALELLLRLVAERPPLKLAVGDSTLGGEMEENTPARAQSASMAIHFASSPPHSSPPMAAAKYVAKMG